MSPKPPLKVTDPDDGTLLRAWDEWQFWVSQSGSSPRYEAKAREWREMYLGLLARKDRLAAGTSPRQED